jgi:hypothetical protein
MSARNERTCPDYLINISTITGDIVHKVILFLVLSKRSLIHSPGVRLYPPACKLYGLEAEPEAQTASS